MKKLTFLLLTSSLLITACQKPVSGFDTRLDRLEGDSIIIPGDTMTYEVITADPGGWFGVWNGADGVLTSNGLDSITWGNPNYLPGGWRYTFIMPSRPFQALISAAVRSYAYDITVNLYKNGQLIKSAFNESKMRGMSKLMVNAQTDNWTGTVSDPVLTYEVVVTEPDSSKFEPDAWQGQWNTPAGVVNDYTDRLLGSAFPMSSGWKYSFKPEHRPFRMYMEASPYTTNGGKVTIHFLVNGQLVKSISSRDWMYYAEYIVQ